MIKLTEQQIKQLNDYERVLEELEYTKAHAKYLAVKHLFPNEDDNTRRQIRLTWEAKR